MNWIIDLFENRFIITAIAAWLCAQITKTILYTIINKKFDIWRLFGDGGMPSGHAATVSSLATASGITYGIGSFEFAICLILAIIVCHDAMGVRLETGKQAKVLNEIVKSFDILSTDELPEVKLKEFVGHTPVQVFFGIILGIMVAFLIYAF